MPPLQSAKLMDLAHWFDPNPGPPSPYYVLVALVLAAGLGIALYFSFVHVPRAYADHTFKAQVFGRFGKAFAILFGLGLILALLRYVQVPYLSARFLLYTDLAAAGLLALFGVFYFSRLFPVKLAAYEAEALRRRYLPKPGLGKRGKKKRPKKARV